MSEKESRPRHEGDSQKVIAATTTSIDPRYDHVRQLAYAHRRAIGRRPCKHLRTYRPCPQCRRERIAEQLEWKRICGRSA